MNYTNSDFAWLGMDEYLYLKKNNDFYFGIMSLYSGIKLGWLELFDLHASNAHRDVFVHYNYSKLLCTQSISTCTHIFTCIHRVEWMPECEWTWYRPLCVYDFKIAALHLWLPLYTAEITTCVSSRSSSLLWVLLLLLSLSDVVSLYCCHCSWAMPITFCSRSLKCQMCCPGDLPTPLCWHSRIWWETLYVWPHSLAKVNWTVHIFLMYRSLSTFNNKKKRVNY